MVAIGASTGGIHAMCLLLGALPRRFAPPIVVVQHLPASFMETLARQVAIASGRPAVVAAPGMPIEPGRIHVAPGDGHLVVRREGRGLVCAIAHHAVPSGCTPSLDPTFESIADTVGSRALGVVLSGMGRDGALGAARLAAAGGTLFAQDAATSAVWGMPRAIAEAGLASAVLPPEAIAQRRGGDGGHRRGGGRMSGISERIVADLLFTRTGQQLTEARRWRIQTALAGLFRDRGISNIDQLVCMLAEPREATLAQEVVEALLNNETYFFRDRLMFDILAREVLPDLAARRADTRRLSIWSAGCSTGQEALSIAMLFADDPARWAGWTIDILGTDISGKAIAGARRGVYSQFEIQRGLGVSADAALVRRIRPRLAPAPRARPPGALRARQRAGRAARAGPVRPRIVSQRAALFRARQPPARLRAAGAGERHRRLADDRRGRNSDRPDHRLRPRLRHQRPLPPPVGRGRRRHRTAPAGTVNRDLNVP